MSFSNRISFRLIKWVSLLSFIILTAEIGLSQTPATTKPDIYANFIGVWVGTGTYMKDHVRTTTPLEVTITETKEKHAILLDYVRSKKGEKDYARSTKILTLLPASSEMLMYWKGEDQDHYTVPGLDEFLKIGFGAFNAFLSYVESGHTTTYRATFQLQKDSFNYQWAQSLDGQGFVVSSVFLLTRSTPSSVASSQ